MNISLSVFKTKPNPGFLVRLPAAMASSQGNQLIRVEKEKVERQAYKINQLKFADILLKKIGSKILIITLK